MSAAGASHRLGVPAIAPQRGQRTRHKQIPLGKRVQQGRVHRVAGADRVHDLDGLARDREGPPSRVKTVSPPPPLVITTAVGPAVSQPCTAPPNQSASSSLSFSRET